MRKLSEVSVFKLLYFIYYLSFAILSVNMIPFLRDIGYDQMQRGIMFAILAITSIILQFSTGYICDKFNVLKLPFIILNIVMAIFCFFNYYLQNMNFILHLIYISALGGLYRMIYNLLDSWVLECQTELAKQFGPIRAFGALGFTLGALISTTFIKQLSYQSIPYMVVACVMVGSYVAYQAPAPTKSSGLSKIKREDFQALINNKAYLLLILIFLLVNIVGTADQYSTVDKLMALEASEQQLGYKWSIQSVCEIPVFLFGNQLLAKITPYRLMVVGIFLYFIKFMLYGYVSSINAMLLVTALQLITYPLITLSAKILVADIAKASALKTSVQMIATGIYLGLSGLLSPLISGYLIGIIGNDMTLYLLGALLIIPFIISLKYRILLTNSSKNKV